MEIFDENWCDKFAELVDEYYINHNWNKRWLAQYIIHHKNEEFIKLWLEKSTVHDLVEEVDFWACNIEDDGIVALSGIGYSNGSGFFWNGVEWQEEHD